MTVQEAIELLSEIRCGYNCFIEEERPFYKALSVAIEVLSAQEKPYLWQKEMVKILSAQLDNNSTEVDNRNDELSCSEKPNRSDLIRRQDAIDALDVLCQEYRYKIPGKRETYSQYNEAWQDALGRAEGAIGNLPSAQPERGCDECVFKPFKQFQPERKKGEWIWQMYENIYRCSECETETRVDECMEEPIYNYCPYCGSYNGGNDDGDE